MLKEVGASGQILLGKKYAGQLFDMQIGADLAVTLRPVRVVPVTNGAPQGHPSYAAAAIPDWTEMHSEPIAQYNAWASQREPYSQRVRHWREAQSAGPDPLPTPP